MARRKKWIDGWSATVMFSLAAIFFVAAKNIFIGGSSSAAKIYFLAVHSGNSILAALPGNVHILFDAGGDATAAQLLGEVLPPGDRSIDLAILSYPQTSDYAGYQTIIDQYRVGAFLYDGRNDISEKTEWTAFLEKLKAKNIPMLTLGAGDRIHYENTIVQVLSPDKDLARSAEISDASLVMRLKTPEFSVLLPADAREHVGSYLLSKGIDLGADILKMPYPAAAENPAASEVFLSSSHARIVIVQPGAKGASSNPTEKEIAALASSTAATVLRPDKQGTVEISAKNGKLLLNFLKF